MSADHIRRIERLESSLAQHEDRTSGRLTMLEMGQSVINDLREQVRAANETIGELLARVESAEDRLKISGLSVNDLEDMPQDELAAFVSNIRREHARMRQLLAEACDLAWSCRESAETERAIQRILKQAGFRPYVTP